MTEDEYRAEYQAMSNVELAELVVEGQDGYLPEAWRALQVEVATRKVDPDLSEAIEQAKLGEDDEWDAR